MVGVILAAGDGKRLKSSSKEDCCKPLIKVNGKRLIEYALDNLLKLGVDKTYIVVGKEGNLIKKVLGNNYSQLQLLYVVQEEQNGLIDAFMQAVKVIDNKESIVFQLSDEIFIGLEAEKIKQSIRDSLYDFYCGVTIEDDPEKIKCNYSVEINEYKLIKKCTEKPTLVFNNIKGTGFCIFSSKTLQILRNIQNVNDEKLYDLCDYLNYLSAANQKGVALNIAAKEFNINTFADLFEVQDYSYVD